MIAILKYNAGNSTSVYNVLNRLGHDCIVTSDPDTLYRADKIIFPGVGEAGTAMKFLKEHSLDELLLNATQPVLGICLGLQLMCSHSQEGDTECLGIFETEVKKFPPKELVPQIGWNNFSQLSGILFDNISLEDDMYYVHSYYAELCDSTVAVCDYILSFSASMQKDNYFATQFHPEKSAKPGEQLLLNFLKL